LPWSPPNYTARMRAPTRCANQFLANAYRFRRAKPLTRSNAVRVAPSFRRRTSVLECPKCALYLPRNDIRRSDDYGSMDLGR